MTLWNSSLVTSALVKLAYVGCWFECASWAKLAGCASEYRFWRISFHVIYLLFIYVVSVYGNCIVWMKISWVSHHRLGKVVRRHRRLLVISWSWATHTIISHDHHLIFSHLWIVIWISTHICIGLLYHICLLLRPTLRHQMRKLGLHRHWSSSTFSVLGVLRWCS